VPPRRRVEISMSSTGWRGERSVRRGGRAGGRAGGMMTQTPMARIRAICLGLPDVAERPFGGHTSPAFRVRDKMFVVVSEDETSMTLHPPGGTEHLHQRRFRSVLRAQVRRQQGLGRRAARSRRQARLGRDGRDGRDDLRELRHDGTQAPMGAAAGSLIRPGQARRGPRRRGNSLLNLICAAQRAIVMGEGTTITDLEIPLTRESHRP
jgi:hypothetical protein